MIAAAAVLLSVLAAAQSAALAAPSGHPQDLAAAMAQYHAALEAYNAAHAAFAEASDAYWNAIAEKRRLRARKRANGEAVALDDYVLTQPPVYSGPPRPRDPSKPNEPPQPPPYVPVVTDFLAAAQDEFNFSPHRPQSESDYKRAYARVAIASGLSPDQVVRIYGFEATGNGNYDIQAGLEYNKQGRAITTALGYNQLLATNSVEIIAESGQGFIAGLAAYAAQLPEREMRSLDARIGVLKRMVAFARSVPDDWNKHQMLAGTARGLAVHALNLDIEIGPLLQTQKLLDSVNFARRKGHERPLTAAELEMMNLTGDGNGYDMVVMPLSWRDRVPTSNFFQRSGYRDNPVAQRNNVVSKLIAATDQRMDQESGKPGARELAAALR
jgi:hypothetical protein